MQYVDPRLASMNVDEIFITGKLSGSFDFVRFESQDPIFLKRFPTGVFDTMFINYNDFTPDQIRLMETAQHTVRYILQDGSMFV